MSTSFNIPKALREQLFQDFGKNPSAWPQELRDLIDPTIEAVSISPPESGRVVEFLNTDFHYHWAEDRNGATPFHERVESMRYAGWQFATTDDVRMANESVVVGRDEKRKSKDGKGFSDEIRSGDRRMMKLPMRLWRANRKAQIMAGFQLAYPQPMGKSGPMSTTELIPGFPTTMMDDAAFAAERSKAGGPNSVTIQHKEKD